MAVFVFGTVGGLMDLGTICLHVAALWPHHPAVVEADPDGGRLAVRHNWEFRPGLGELAAALRTDMGSPVESAAHRLRNGVKVVVAPPSVESVLVSVDALSQSLALLEARTTCDVLIDVGIVRPGTPARDLIAGATRRVIVVRKDVDELVVLAHRRPFLESMGEWSVLTAGGRLKSEEVMEAIQWPVLADLLPNDRRASAKLKTALENLSITRDRVQRHLHV